MISCEMIRDLLSLYADGLVSENSKQRIEAHLTHCAECRRIMREMCAPVEPEVDVQRQEYQKAMRAQRRKNRRRLFLACILSVLCCVIGWILYMETHFYVETVRTVTTDGQKILSELPELALNEAEKKLGDQLWETELVQESLGCAEPVDLPLNTLQELLPANTVCVSVHSNNVTIEYTHNGMRAFLEYLGGNSCDEVSAIRKTLAVPKSKQDVSVKAIYTLEYVFALDKTWYQKQVAQHEWFGFLEWM